MATIDIQDLPLNLQKKHNFSSSAGLIARLAVEKLLIRQNKTFCGVGKYNNYFKN